MIELRIVRVTHPCMDPVYRIQKLKGLIFKRWKDVHTWDVTYYPESFYSCVNGRGSGIKDFTSQESAMYFIKCFDGTKPCETQVYAHPLHSNYGST